MEGRFARRVAAFAALSLFTMAEPLTAQAALPPFRVVIDPGHGGADHGTIYEDATTKVAEKDVTLRLAKLVANELGGRGISVVLTRHEDQDLPLNTRTAIANKLKADLFLSIHMNSGKTVAPGSAEGIETYILNGTTDATSRRLAHFENTGLGTAQVEDPGQLDVALILRDLRLDANLPESKRLACMIQNNLSSSAHLRDRGVRQALFHVLLGADMPSALVEAGFLTHPRDREFVLSPLGQRSISTAIARAIETFRRSKATSLARVTLSRCKVH